MIAIISFVLALLEYMHPWVLDIDIALSNNVLHKYKTVELDLSIGLAPICMWSIDWCFTVVINILYWYDSWWVKIILSQVHGTMFAAAPC